MRSSAVALMFSLGAVVLATAGIVYAHRVAIVFEPGSTDLPQAGVAVLKSLSDDVKRECLQGGYVTVEVIEAVTLPLGRVSSGPTARTQRIAAALRESSPSLQPYERSISPASAEARRLGLEVNQVSVELSCPPAKM